MEKEDKKGIFFGVIGVLTLIVAIVGASLAYFSISAGSDDDVVQVQAATVQIVYEDGDDLLVAGGIIPSTKEVALETYRRSLNGETYSTEVDGEKIDVPYQECVDDRGYTVCGVYEFTLTNKGGNPVEVTAKVVPTALEEGAIQFTNLKFSLYDITGVAATDYGTEVTAGGLVTYVKEGFSLVSSNLRLDKNTTSKYRLFVWLDETGEEQDAEQGATFNGTIVVDVSGAGSTITGNADKTLGTN